MQWLRADETLNMIKYVLKSLWTDGMGLKLQQEKQLNSAFLIWS